jgi:membrane associated rhomboid family serine protease
MSEPASFVSHQPSAPRASHAPREFGGRPVITLALIAINVLLFLAPAVVSPGWLWKPTAQQLLAWGANFGPLTLHGQARRLVTCCFLHLGVIHIGMNMLVLLQVGTFAEQLYGRVRLLLIYMLAGLGGSLASALKQPPIVSVGASGAIFGVYGAVLAFLLMQRHIVDPGAAGKVAKGAGIFLLFNLIYGLASPGVDMRAHIGGLAVGFVFALPLALPIESGRQRAYPLRSAVVLGTGLAMVAGILAVTSKRITPADELQRLVLTGNRIAVGQNDTIVYSGSATAADAQALARALEPTRFFSGKGATLLLRKDAEGSTLSLVTNDKDPARPGDGSAPRPDPGARLAPRAWDDPAFLLHARVIGTFAAPAMGGPPINVAILTEDGIVARTLRIDTRIARVGNRDAVWYSGGATVEDALVLGKSLQSAGFFRDTGGLVLLTSQNGVADVSLMVREGAWDQPQVLEELRPLSGILASSLRRPVRLHLVDKTMTPRKDL